MIKDNVCLVLFNIVGFVMERTLGNVWLVLGLISWVLMEVFVIVQLDRGQFLMVDVVYVLWWTVLPAKVQHHQAVQSANQISPILNPNQAINASVSHHSCWIVLDNVLAHLDKVTMKFVVVHPVILKIVKFVANQTIKLALNVSQLL